MRDLQVPLAAAGKLRPRVHVAGTGHRPLEDRLIGRVVAAVELDDHG